MSEFLAEAQVLVVPNTAAFAASLRTQLNAAVAKAGPVVVPVLAAPSAVAATSAATLAAAQQEATVATLGLSAATGLETKALDLAAKAQLDAAAAAMAAGAAAQVEAAEIASLIAAQQAAAIAFAKTEAIALASVGSTSALAASRATLRAATIAVTANEVAFDAALATTSVAMKNNAADALLEARALQANAQAAFESAVAHRADAIATTHDAAAHSQAVRGIAAETLALTGLRGATLAASAPFLIGATAAIIFAKSIKEASDQTEEINKVAEVFGRSSAEVEKFAKTTATSLGISETEALKATGIFGNLFRAIHIAEPVAAAMSVQLVKLAADLASFNNASPERTLEALRAGLVGQARPLRVFGAFLTAARVQQEALLETGKKSIRSITEAEKVQARYNLILQDTILAQGDVERTQDRLANQSRILSAQLSNIAGTIGKTLLPALLLVIQDVNLTIQAFERLSKLRINIPAAEKGGSLDLLKNKVQDILGERQSRNIALNFLFPGLGFGINNLELLNIALKKIVVVEDDTSKATDHLNDALDAGARAARLAAFAIVSAQVAVQDLGSSLKGLEIEQLKIQTGLTPGGRQAEEANLRKQIADDKKVVALTESGTKARREALLDLKSKQNELAGLEAQDARDAQDRVQRIKDAAAQQKRVAEEIAKAQEDATRAFIDGFDPRKQKILNALGVAGLTDRLSDDLKFETALKQFLKNEIDAIKARIKRLNLHGAALKAARAAIAAINQEIFQITQDIAADQKAAQERTQDILNQKLDFKIQIAQARDDVAAEIRARRAKLAQITKELVRAKKEFGKNSLAWLELKAAQAEQIAAIKALQNQNKTAGADARKEAAAFLFSQLQAQQGFASNLLGNLIPSGQTSGLVGVPSPTTGPGKGVSVAASVQEAKASSGPTAGQANATINRLDKIIAQLKELNGDQKNPEAHRQRKGQHAVMDYGAGGGDGVVM